VFTSCFLGVGCEELLAPRPTLKLEYHLLSAIRDYLCSAFSSSLHARRP